MSFVTGHDLGRAEREPNAEGFSPCKRGGQMTENLNQSPYMANVQFLTALSVPIVVYLAGFYIQNLMVGGLLSQLNDPRSEMNFGFARLDQKFDGLTSKVVDIDNRLIRVEERIKL